MKRILMYLLPLWGLFFSCTVDERVVERTGPEGENSDEVTLNFSVRVPGQSTPISSTRSMSETAENYIESIDVLVFEVGSSGDERYLYRAQGKNIQSGVTASEKSFEVTLIKQAGSAYRLVVLANASSQLNKLEPISGNGVADKEELLERLIYENTSEWNATDSVPGMFDPFPMWGESQVTGITDNMEIKDLKFLRMTARVDVVLHMDIDNFKLQEVYVYNRQTSGYIVPNMADTTWTSTGLKVNRATVPTGSPTIAVYQDVHLATGDTACVRDIYLMESNAGTSLSNATCIVVGGKYGTSPTTTYYRLDFLESDKTTYKDILRNHLYRFTINSVSGAGHSNPEEAFNALPMNMEAEILEWDEGEMSKVVFDGQYMLSVSQGEFRLPRDEMKDQLEQNRLMIYTDYDVEPNAGWKIDKIVGELGEDISEDWLSVHRWEGPAGVKTPVYLYLEENEGAGFRVGYIHISAGRLNFVVKVEQTDEPEINLRVYEILSDGSRVEVTDLVFSAHADSITPREFLVEWAPVRGDFRVSESEIGNTGLGFAYDETGGSGRVELGSLDYPGSYSCTLFPTAMTADETDPENGGAFLEKSSRIDFTINNGVSYLTKSLYLRQVNYGLTYEKDNIYLMDGKEHHLTVKSNTTWKVEVWRDTAHVITNLKTLSGGNSPHTGQMVRFELIDDITKPEIFQATVELLFTSALFDSVFVSLRCGSGVEQKPSNTYIVKPGGIGILIPVGRANEHSNGSIGASDEFTAELLWTDNDKGMADDSNIRLITESGTGSSGHILVLPGTGEGNAVVAVRNNKDGQIKWSWHIWVTDYDPVSDHTLNGNHFMDRNLGATTNTQDERTSMGLLYQWGRKDPFPGAPATTSTSSSGLTVYDASGSTTRVPLTETASTGTQPLSLSIANPTTFYLGNTSNNYDWYRVTSNSNTRNDNLWGNGFVKTIYDPCPVGWRVPSFNGSTSPWNSLTNSNFSWSVNGRVHSGSYYPAAGNRSCSMGSIFLRPGYDGCYWTASPDGDQAYYLKFDNTPNSGGVSPNSSLSRAYANSVRCVQE